MPILGQETSIYPDDLLDDQAGEPSDRRWWVVYTKARQEKSLVRDLLGRHIPFFLPLIEKPALRRGRRVSSYTPMFSGYVFLFGSEAERTAGLRTNRVSRVLAVDDQPRLLFDLRQLHKAIESGAALSIESRLQAGDRVRVRAGPLANLEGTVLMRRGKTRLLVAVNFLQKGASVEIDDFLLEPLD
jgi:transcription antitermination factor NusG